MGKWEILIESIIAFVGMKSLTDGLHVWFGPSFLRDKVHAVTPGRWVDPGVRGRDATSTRHDLLASISKANDGRHVCFRSLHTRNNWPPLSLGGVPDAGAPHPDHRQQDREFISYRVFRSHSSLFRCKYFGNVGLF